MTDKTIYQFSANTSSPSWTDISKEAFDEYSQRGEWLTRALLAAPVVERQEPVACSHEWTDDGEFTLICTKCGAQESHEPYGWVQTRGDAINHFTQEWDVVQEWEDSGFEYKTLFDHASPPASVAVALPSVQDVIAERLRQRHVEGWTPEHDDSSDCELAAAAATYALCTSPEQLKICGVTAWPWADSWWKPTTYRRNLVKAGALILAEIDRLDRLDKVKELNQ